MNATGLLSRGLVSRSVRSIVHTEDRAIRLAGAIAVVLILYLLRTVLVSFLVAMALACVLSPLADKVTRRLRWSRDTIVSSIAVGLVIALGLLSCFMVPVFSERVRTLAAEAPEYVRALEETFSSDRAAHDPVAQGAYRWVLSRVEKSLVNMLDRTVEVLIGFASRLHHLIAIPILVFYMVKDAPLIGHRFQAVLPAPYREVAAVLFGSCYRASYGYIYGQLVLSGVAGALTTIGLMLFGIPHALVLGTASGIVEAVPYLGPIAVGTVAALIALPQGTGLVLKVIVLYVAIRLLIDLVIGPRVLGRAMHLHPLTVLFALLAGSHLLGVVGFFVAPPLAAMATPVVDRVFGQRGRDEELPSDAVNGGQVIPEVSQAGGGRGNEPAVG